MTLAGTTVARHPLLLIEDEASIVALMRRALENKGYRVVAASSGVEGIKLLGSGEFLGVITDMRTPGGVSGGHLHAWIESHRPELASRVIFVTGDTANEETMAILQQTGAPYVAKPFNLNELVAMVEKTFGKSQ